MAEHRSKYFEALRRLPKRISGCDFVQQGFTALQNAGFDESRIEQIARMVNLDREDLAYSIGSALPSPGVVRGQIRQDSNNGFDEMDRRLLTEIRRILNEEGKAGGSTLGGIYESLREIRQLLVEQQASQLAKEWYAVDEVAKLTGYKPYTIRQCCNTGRISEEWTNKHHRTGEWRIHRDAVDSIQNHGLPPVK